MIGFEQRLELINLKERIANNQRMSNRIASLIGQSKGWNELGIDWKLTSFMIRGLKQMPVCELCYSKKEFSIMRQELYSIVKEETLKNMRKPLVILNSPKAQIEIHIQSTKPIMVITTLKNRKIEYISVGNGELEKLSIKHDANSPLYIMGEMMVFECVGQRLNECYFVNPSYKLKRIDLSSSQISVENISNILLVLPTFCKHDLFDEEPSLLLSIEITHELYSLAKLKRWKVIN